MERWSTPPPPPQPPPDNSRRGELAVQFQTDHGRPPTAVEALQLAQQANLETRDAKHEPRSEAEQRRVWLAEAAAVLGGRGAITAMIATAFAADAETARVADARWVAQTADRIVSVMEDSRPTWQMWHVRAEAERQIRTINLPAEQANTLVELLVDEVLDYRSIALTAPPDGIEEPEALRRADGSSTCASSPVRTTDRVWQRRRRAPVRAGSCSARGAVRPSRAAPCRSRSASGDRGPGRDGSRCRS